jgi:hypothetical protein
MWPPSSVKPRREPIDAGAAQSENCGWADTQTVGVGMHRHRLRTFVRGLSGAVAGGTVGLIIEWIYAHNWPPVPSFPYPVFGPVCWGAACSLLFLIAGSARAPTTAQALGWAFVGGMIAGALLGATAYPSFLTAPPADDLFRGKVQGMYIRQGVFFGMPIGGLVGLLLGAVLIRRAGPAPLTPDQRDSAAGAGI